MKRAGKEKSIAIYLPAAEQERETLCREYAGIYFPDSASLALYMETGEKGDSSAWEALVADARADSLSAVICPSLAELCRGAADFIAHARMFDELGIPLIFVKERLDTSSATGRTVLYAAELFLHLEKHSSAANIRDSMRLLARTGRWLGGVTPTGYASFAMPSVEAEEKGHGAYGLKVLPDQAEIIRRIFADFLRLDSLTKVADALEKDGIKTKNGRAFSRFTVRQILENPVYMKADADAYLYFMRSGAEVCSDESDFDGKHGVMAYNKTIQKGGQANRQRGVSEWIVAVGMHEGLVSGADWITVSEQLARNRSEERRKPKNEHALLAGLLVCGDCGAHMRPKLTRRQNAAGEAIFAYLCEQKEHTHGIECDVRNLGGNRADHAVLELLREIDPNTKGILPKVPKRRSARGKAEMLKNRRKQLADNEKAIKKMVFTLIKVIDKSAYDHVIKEIDDLSAKNISIKKEIASLEEVGDDHPMAGTAGESARELLNALTEAGPEQPIVQKRAALRTLVEAIEWDGKQLKLRFAGGAEKKIHV